MPYCPSLAGGPTTASCAEVLLRMRVLKSLHILLNLWKVSALQKTLVKSFDSVSNSSSELQGCQWLLHHLRSVIEGPPVGINDPGYQPNCLTSLLPGSVLYLASRLLQTPRPSNHRPALDYCGIIDSQGLVFEMILDKPLQSSVREQSSIL